MKLDVSEKTLSEFLAKPREQLTVPLYQRPYSWTNEEVDQLWEDLTAQMDAEHFMGSIVLNDETPLHPQIIDGQQRLTTLMMLLALVRDEYHRLGSHLQGRPHGLLISDAYAEGEARFRLLLGEVNRSLFRDFFLRDPEDPLRRTLEERKSLPNDQLVLNGDLFSNAARLQSLLEAYLANSDDEERLGRLLALEEKLSLRLLFVVIRVGSVDDAFLLFETLNDRGLQLSAADLVKSHLLSRIESQLGKDKIPEASQDWLEIVDLLRGADIGRFLRYFLLMYNPKVQSDRVFRLFKKRLEDDTAAGLLAHLKTMARYFGEFVQPSALPEPQVRDVIEDINDLRAPTTYVVLLPARHALQDRPDAFVRLARLTESLAYRWTTIAGKNAQQLESIFQEAGHSLVVQGPKGLAKAEARLVEAMPSRAEFLDAFRAKRMGTKYAARYTLRRIEEVLSPTLEWTLKSPSKVNIEHVMPLHLSEPWKQALGPEAAVLHTESVGRWGNLTLLSQILNSTAKDSSFDAKKEIYAGEPGSQIRMTQLLQKESSWGPREIEARQRWLAEVAEQLWSPEGAADPTTVVTPDYPFIDEEAAISEVRLLIAGDESRDVEFKSTGRTNIATDLKDPEIEKSAGKTICAFANADEGGTLLLGVAPDGSIHGIEDDYKFVKDGNNDGYGLWLGKYVKDQIDPILANKLRVSFIKVDDRTVCRVDVPPASAPVFLKDKAVRRFYVRVQNATEEYSGHDLLNYRAERWPGQS